MNWLRKIEVGVLVTMTLAVLGFAFWLGGLQTKIDRLEPNRLAEDAAKKIDPKMLQLFPPGAVVAFHAVDCPSEWRRFEDASDKFIIAAGSKRPFNAQGGADTITLTPREHLLEHRHQLKISDSEARIRGTSFGLQTGGGLQNQVFVYNDKAKTETEATGEKSVRIQYLPPYIALTFCKKN